MEIPLRDMQSVVISVYFSRQSRNEKSAMAVVQQMSLPADADMLRNENNGRHVLWLARGCRIDLCIRKTPPAAALPDRLMRGYSSVSKS